VLSAECGSKFIPFVRLFEGNARQNHLHTNRIESLPICKLPRYAKTWHFPQRMKRPPSKLNYLALRNNFYQKREKSPGSTLEAGGRQLSFAIRFGERFFFSRLRPPLKKKNQ